MGRAYSGYAALIFVFVVIFKIHFHCCCCRHYILHGTCCTLRCRKSTSHSRQLGHQVNKPEKQKIASVKLVKIMIIDVGMDQRQASPFIL